MVEINGPTDKSEYCICIDDLSEDLMVYSSSGCIQRSTTFLVAAQPWNCQEVQTVTNPSPSTPLTTFELTIRKMTGSLATVTNPFTIKLRFD